MLRFLNKPIKFNFYSGAVKSGILWFACVLTYLFFLYFQPNLFTNILLPAILIGFASYIVMVYSLVNILELKLKNFKSKIINFLNPLIISFFIVFLIIGGPTLVIIGIVKMNSLLEVNKTTSLIKITSTQPVSVFNLWDKINDWQKKQGYQPYVQSTFLCDIADNFLDFATYWSDEYLKKNLKSNFNNSNYAWNFSVNRSPEDSILKYWTTNPTSKKNLTDYYYYSCIRCKDNNCLQLFYNEPSRIASNINSNSSNNTEKWGEVKQIDEHTFTQKLGVDTRMGTPSELLTALNNYRNNNGKGSLAWDDNLSSWAQSRAQTYANMGDVDGHAGFNAEVDSKYNEFGRFKGLGENGGFGPRLEAVHTIEWVFAGDQPHRENMLRDWSHVGIAIASSDGYNYGVNFIFGKSR